MVKHANVTHEKREGTLNVQSKGLIFEGPGGEKLKLKWSSVEKITANKEGAAKAMLRIVTTGTDGAKVFHFVDRAALEAARDDAKSSWAQANSNSEEQTKKTKAEGAGERGPPATAGEPERKSKSKSKPDENTKDDNEQKQKPKSKTKTRQQLEPAPEPEAVAVAVAVSSKGGEETVPLINNEENKELLVLKETGWDQPTIPDANKAHYAVTGHESQIITLGLRTGDTCKGEPGTMMYTTGDIKMSATCEGCCARLCSGEDCCVVNFTNNGGEEAYVSLTPNFPTSKIIPIDLSSKDVNGSLICQQGSFMASHGDVQVGMDIDCNFMRCCCGGMGLVRQKLTGTGTVFLESTGTIVQKVLKPGEKILVDTNCVLAFAESCKLDIQRAGNIVGMIGGGEGIFNTSLTGPGLVVVQSMNQLVFLESLVALKIYRR